MENTLQANAVSVVCTIVCLSDKGCPTVCLGAECTATVSEVLYITIYISHFPTFHLLIYSLALWQFMSSQRHDCDCNLHETMCANNGLRGSAAN